MVKKLEKRPLAIVAAETNDEINTSSISPYAGFYVRDCISDQLFLIDTGAFVSVFPACAADRLNQRPNATRLVSASGASISTFGSREIRLRFAAKDFSWTFILADVNKPILGADFLAHHSLLVDVANRRLVDENLSPLPVAGFEVEANFVKPYPSSRYDFVFTEFSAVFRPELRRVPGHVPKHGIFHRIVTSGPPLHSRPRRLNPERLQVAKKYFADMEKMGVCKKASSPWASPLHLVPKSDGTLRPCGDYRRLNNVTVPDRYSPPDITDIFSCIQHAKVFSKLDLLKGYFQIPVHRDDIEKTAIITPFGTYVFQFTTFGLRNSGATFQRVMDSILGDLPFCVVYVDDILIFSNSHEEHAYHLRTVLRLLQENDFVVRPDKCVFGAEEIDFLGHRVSSDGVSPLASKVTAVRRFPRPQSLSLYFDLHPIISFTVRYLHVCHDLLLYVLLLFDLLLLFLVFLRINLVKRISNTNQS